MNETHASQEAIGSIDDLEIKARKAADQLSQATSRNAIWDKAAKALKGGLADLDKTRKDAQQKSDDAHKQLKKLADRYDSDASDSVRKARMAVDGEIEQLQEKMERRGKKFNDANEAVAAAKKSLDESTANFEQAQKKLMGVSKEIQDYQKQVAALKAEVEDADNKRQLIESIVKQEDLRTKLAEFDKVLQREYETNLWNELNSAANDLLEKTDALPIAQAQVSKPEADYKAAKTEYEDAVKNRIDSVKQRVADEDEERPAKEVLAKSEYDASPSTG